MPDLTARQLEILQHALGLDKHGQGTMYRNHFCAGTDDEPVCRSLVEMDYMFMFAPNASPLPYYNCSVTKAGTIAAIEQSPKPPKLTHSQRRYREFLRADTGRSFGEWLKDQREAKDA